MVQQPMHTLVSTEVTLNFTTMSNISTIERVLEKPKNPIFNSTKLRKKRQTTSEHTSHLFHGNLWIHLAWITSAPSSGVRNFGNTLDTFTCVSGFGTRHSETSNASEPPNTDRKRKFSKKCRLHIGDALHFEYVNLPWNCARCLGRRKSTENRTIIIILISIFASADDTHVHWHGVRVPTDGSLFGCLSRLAIRSGFISSLLIHSRLPFVVAVWPSQCSGNNKNGQP